MDITASHCAAAWQRLFAATAGLAGFSQAAWVAAWLAVFFLPGSLASGLTVGTGLLGASLLAGLAAIYFGFRLRLDAALLAMLAPAGPVGPADFAAAVDRFRAQLAGREPIAAGNPLAARYAGTYRLWRRCIAALAVQVVLMVSAAGLAMFKNII